MLVVMFSITIQFAHVHLDMLETHSLVVLFKLIHYRSQKNPLIHAHHRHVDQIQCAKSNKEDLFVHVLPITLANLHTVDQNVLFILIAHKIKLA